MLVTALALVISCLSLPAPWAQTTRVVRKRSISGLSTTSLMLTMWSSLIWLTYGLLSEVPVQVVLNGSATMALGFLLLFAMRSAWVDAKTIVPATLAYALVLGFVASMGVTLLGTVAAMMAVVCRFPQIRKAWQEPGGVAVSLYAQVTSLTCASLWLVFGLLVGDAFVFGTAMFNMATSAFFVTRTHQGRRRAQLVEATKTNADIPLLTAA
jgi:uncharacterized protein with PQ loop repeat